jgi:PAS domain S-box-containing protein
MPASRAEKNTNSAPVGNSVESLYEQIIDSLSSGVIAFDGDGVIIMVNHAAREHLGVGAEQLQRGMRLEDLLPLKPFVDAMHEVMNMHKSVSRREIIVTRSDGTRREIGFSASLLEGPREFNGAVFLFVDITERRTLERAAELNKQLAQIGELTAGVVHELRNPLQVISGMAELLERKFPPDDPGRRKVQAIMNETKGLERLVGQFLGFAKPFQPEVGVCVAEAIVERAFTLCETRAAAKRVALAKEIAAALPEFQADANMLVQVIVNLINNAVDAVTEQGRINVFARREGPDVLFEVKDNGSGITLKPGEDPFKPFFSRKEGGTGLGLAICHRIITAHGGRILYENRDEGGACFTARIPIERGGLR